MRIGRVSRKTSETDIQVEVNLDGTGLADVSTGVKFLNHMLKSLATHSLIDIKVQAVGDLSHHLIEDVAICLGEAILKALGDAKGIKRFGYAIVPMDCSLAFAAVDLSRRPYVKVDLKLRGNKIEDIPCEDIMHFIESLTMALRANVHIWIQYGSNNHHKTEAAFKALALSLRQAVSLDPRRRGVPSSKGVI
ncbi:imidazoleglycerol-phosphate dehydratase HisB [Candidatus Bathyarchaeota archaeon]|nr:MAG: imidazoleglycerol-phosphate dehydratase HisB [Candidatus Bathyarchaeota archaeon]